MNELMNGQTGRNSFRLQLLSTASLTVVLMSAVVSGEAVADDENRPAVWIELGGQLEQMSGLGDPFVPPFTQRTPTPVPYQKASPVDAQHSSRFSVGGEGKLTFEPTGSDWVFSAQIRYGRSHKQKHIHQQTNFAKSSYRTGSTYYNHPSPYIIQYQPAARFTDNTIKQSQSHMILDFMAGKDVGLGMLGRGSSSVISAGVRYAQFSSSATMAAKAVPTVDVFNLVAAYYPAFLNIFPKFFIPASHYVQYSAFATSYRSFHGIGPALSWNASVPMIGNERAGELTFDWDINGAVLFGRQTSKTSHHSTTHFKTQKYPPTPTVTHPAMPRTRSRSVVVPNLGLSAAVSYRVENFKATLGYRGDFFFGAVDTGWDAQRTSDLTFHGPFLNFSLGL